MPTRHLLLGVVVVVLADVACSGKVAGGSAPSEAGMGGSAIDAGMHGSGGGSGGPSSTGGRVGGTGGKATGGGVNTGGVSVGGASGVCSVDADCSAAACGQCPDGSKLCPMTRCFKGFGGPGPGYCTTDPAACPQCKVDADCPPAACTVCTDGSTACSSQKCSNGSCGNQSVSVCANRTGPDCTSASQCPAPVCRTCPDGSKVCTDAGCTNGRCHADSVQCPQCKSDGDCGKPLCSVCYDGSTACGTATCQKGQCTNSSPTCPERPTGMPLLWYSTCGFPVCRAPSNPDAGARDASVSCAAEGTSCTQRGATCGDPSANCGSVLVCEDHDPKSGGCPISSAKFKDDIRYLAPGDLEHLRDETLKFRLANYRYKPEFTEDPNAQRLGFIIEDNPQSPAVDRGHDRVDLYGYVSMVVATMQVQQKEIESLRRELRALRAARRGCER